MGDTGLDAQRQAFWQTLLAMGFEPAAACAGTYSGVALDAQVFAQGIYHAKAAELLLHFLFTHLDAPRFKREFFDSWPIGDARQARDFRAHAFRWLDEIRRESVERADGRWPADVPVRRSFVDESRGLRFEHVLWALARLVAVRLLQRGGAWARHLERALVAPADAHAEALERARARYARRTRDRLRAQHTWRRSADALERQIGATRAQRDRVHDAFRVCRKRLGAAAAALNVDAPATAVEQALAQTAADAAQLWSGSAGWVEEHGRAIRVVDAVLGRRANAVRLEPRHVRLAPPPQLAAQWTRWLATRGATPFRGANVDLGVLARMAAASVGALRHSIATPEPLALPDASASGDTAALPALPDDGDAQLRSLDAALAAQDARIARLKRLRARLTGQLRDPAVQLAPTGRGPVAQLLASLACAPDPAADRSVTGGSAGAQPMAERAQQLAAVWDDLVDDEYPAHVCEAALRGVARATPFSSGLAGMSVFSDRATPAARKRARDEPNGDESSGDGMLVDEQAPDFLVN
ncbi:hypothetical protein IWW54_002812 [Coemansia sp. RSA 2705]|nr:hypothetical protein IWW54_002812 [Coemansia sp. RSA 2705]